MRWGVVVAVIFSVVAALLVIIMLPLKVSVRFTRARGKSTVRVWVGVLSGLVWIPVYRKVPPRPGEERGRPAATAPAAGGGPDAHEDGAVVISTWISRARSMVKRLGGPDDGVAQGDGKGRSPDCRRRGSRRIASFFYAVLKSTGLDVHRLRVRVALGSGEAATTAIGVGLAYALINTGLAASPVPLRFLRGKPDINIVPRYDRAGLDASVDCIVALTPGYIILRGIRVKRRRRRMSCPTTR